MAIDASISEIYSKNILAALRRTLIFGQTGVINRNYEGEIKDQGDTVHITNIDDPAVRPYSKANAITWDELADHAQSLTIDQGDYFAFRVQDIDKVQSAVNFVTEASNGAGYNLRKNADTFLATTMAAGVDSGNQIGAATVTTADAAYDLIVQLRAKLQLADVPDVGRWLVIPTDVYSLLLKDDRFVKVDASGTSAGLRNGQVGSALGFQIMESNNLPIASGATTVLAGYQGATTYAEQIVQTESIRLQDYFADGLRGLHVYGAKVIRPTGLASAVVTTTPPSA
jgi:N4-gp56 family major capsid protein